MDTKKMSDSDMCTVTVAASVLGGIIGVSERRIRQMADEGIIKRVSKGRYALIESVKRYILTLKTGQDKGDTRESLDPDEAKAKHELVKIEISELKLKLMKGELHKAEDVERVLADMLVSFRSKLMNLPNKLAPKLANVQDKGRVNAILMKEVAECLTELSEYNPEDFYPEEYIDSEDDYE